MCDMKKYAINMLLIIMAIAKLNSQEVYQQTTLEFDDVLNENQSYLCQATKSIELLPGLDYRPATSNEMRLEIDRYSVYPPMDGIYGGNDCSENCVVGTIPGTLDVSATGAATYSVDIQLPRALGTMTPKLTIAYNNQSMNGLLGWSWDLLGLSAVERIGQTEYHDGRNTNVDFVNDRYVLDGQRLMTVGDNEYRTEIDNFDKIVSCNGTKKGPDYFIVWKSDGTIWEYGSTPDSKVEPQGNNNVVLKWLVSKITDRDGNAITYNYYENNATGESYIKNIEYSWNEKAGVKPAYNIAFQYTERMDPKVGFVHGSMVADNKILKNISVCSNYSGKKMIEYSFEYDNPGYYENDYYIHHRLNSIHLAIDGKKINPTRIIWNSKDKRFANGYRQQLLDKNKFNKASFVGDFNGDGFSDVLLIPYKIQNAYSANVEGEVYLNNRDGSFSTEPLTKITFDKNLDWIYVCDIDGDGIDDIVPYELHYDNLGAFDMVRFTVFIMTDGRFLSKKTYTYAKPIMLLPGAYLDRNSCGLLLVDAYDGGKNKKMAGYIHLKNGVLVSEEIQNSNVINGKDINCLAMDMSGDGVSELLSLEENGYKVFKITDAGVLKLELYCGGYDLTKEIYPFPNDYNGDGKIDMLYYDPAKFWNIKMSDGVNFSKSMLCMNNNLLRTVRLNAKDRYRYSLKEMQNPTVTIRTADFDGDGTADIGVFSNKAGNYYLDIGFSLREKAGSYCEFLYQRRYYMPLNYSHQTIQLGQFLPQENVSVLSGLPSKPSSASKALVVSLCPNSACYTVEQIIDGLGNSMELLYAYLINSIKDDFYTCDGVRNYYSVERKSIPLLALKEIKTYSVNGKPITKNYSYHNALVHRKGHGFMGFECVTVRNYVDDNLINRQIQEYKLEAMDSNCMPLLNVEKMFHGEKQLIKEHYFEYERYTCAKNSKVVTPLLSRDREAVYDVDKKYVVLKNIITTNTYESDVASDKTYDNIVRLKMTKKGFDNVKTVHPETCQYVEEVSMTYDDDIYNWIVNRPKKIIKSVRDKVNDAVGSCQIFEYDVSNPTRVVKETMIPNVQADMSDSLMVVVKYKHDIVGNILEQTLSSPSLKSDKVVKSEYGYNYKYRYKTKSIDELGREIMCKYDADFGILESTVDYNNLITRVEKSPFGVKDVMTMPDGMVNMRVLRWSDGNKYAPSNSSYYSWDKNTGASETMVFYHKSGAELRSVAFDINGRAVIIDKVYDDYGNLVQETYPYYEKEDKLLVSNVYDAYNRVVETIYPNDMNVSYIYDGNDVQKEYSTADAMRKYKKETYNIMGWVTSVTDGDGSVIKYDYYSDGMLKSAQIGEDKNSRISVDYDNRRNKTSMYDPNYGLVSYKNDALGNVRKIVNAQDVVEIDYDVLGRMVTRIERSLSHNTKNIVHWEYETANGRNGVLNRVYTLRNHQVEYVYDDKLRLVAEQETINGHRYRTAYSYDEANRISSVSYPSGFGVSKEYSNSGYERRVRDAKTQTVLWETKDTNSNGFITDFHLGNGLKTHYSYNPASYMIEKIETIDGDAVIQDMSYGYDGMCNLTYRRNNKDYNLEEFEYDSYDRLTKIILNGEVKGKMSYHKNGNICDKEMNGVRVMYNTEYAEERPNAIVGMKSDDENMHRRSRQDIKYSFFDNVSVIAEGNKSLSINYGYDNSRIATRSVVDGNVKMKTYVGDCEYVKENGKDKVLTYLTGPMGVFAVHVNDGTESIHYIHKDNLESWVAITDEAGKVLEELSFDAWGNMRDPKKWEESAEGELLYDRGFTGQEHLCDFGLINMNGRLYDPLMSMMLSPDNNIQMPKSVQNFNRYSYCLNNPLKYNDPTGEWVESVVMGVVGGASNLVFNARNIDSFGEAALLFGVGFVKGFLTEITMGQSWFLQVGVGTVVGGLTAGANRMVSVGDGGFSFSGDDWNSIKTASHYGLGSSLVKSVMYTYMTEPTENQYGESFFESCYNKELAHGVTSLIAHGTGCWFSGQPLVSTMKFKDVGFDLKMLGVIAKRLLASYISGLDFAEQALDERARSIKDSIMKDLLSELPDTPDFEYTSELLGVFVEDFRLYVVGNVFQMIPGEWLDSYPKPYMEEVITFPFSYSLFRSLFFNKQ